MTFTDADLKRLKFHVTGNGPDAWADGVSCKTMSALLARLEAAEALIPLVGAEGYEYSYIDKLLKSWRRAKGESD